MLRDIRSEWNMTAGRGADSLPKYPYYNEFVVAQAKYSEHGCMLTAAS